MFLNIEETPEKTYLEPRRTSNTELEVMEFTEHQCLPLIYKQESQLTFNCSKLTIEILERGAKHVQS